MCVDMWTLSKTLGPLLLSVLVPFSVARTEPAAEGPNTFVSRIEALALMQTLRAEILASRSATSILEKWCASRSPWLVGEHAQCSAGSWRQIPLSLRVLANPACSDLPRDR